MLRKSDDKLLGGALVEERSLELSELDSKEFVEGLKTKMANKYGLKLNNVHKIVDFAYFWVNHSGPEKVEKAAEDMIFDIFSYYVGIDSPVYALYWLCEFGVVFKHLPKFCNIELFHRLIQMIKEKGETQHALGVLRRVLFNETPYMAQPLPTAGLNLNHNNFHFNNNSLKGTTELIEVFDDMFSEDLQSKFDKLYKERLIYYRDVIELLESSKIFFRLRAGLLEKSSRVFFSAKNLKNLFASLNDTHNKRWLEEIPGMMRKGLVHYLAEYWQVNGFDMFGVKSLEEFLQNFYYEDYASMGKFVLENSVIPIKIIQDRSLLGENLYKQLDRKAA